MTDEGKSEEGVIEKFEDGTTVSRSSRPSESERIAAEMEKADSERLERVSHELFDKLSVYLETELSGTKDTYALLQELNTLTIDQYSSLSHSATQIKDSLHDLDVKYKLLLPYLEQLNQLDVSVASLEQATLRLDAYTKVLESKFKKLEKR